MKRSVFILILALFLNQLSAQNSTFLGGSVNLNNNSSNIFIGYQITSKTAIITNYYQKNIFSIDFLYNGFVLSNGFSIDNDQEKRFTTLLYTPKIYQVNKKWKIFGKVGINLSGIINKANFKKVNSIFGIGLRWN